MATTPPILKTQHLVGVSLKMYFTLAQTQSYTAALSTLSLPPTLTLFLIPDFISLLPASEALRSTNILLGAQDTFWEDTGAYTGEISPQTLAEAGVRIVEIGHAERRRMFGETDAHVALKAKAATRNGLVPLVCIGERTHGRIASEAVGLAIAECLPQVRAVLDAIPEEAEVVFAYEPVWAIGQAEPAEADHVVAVARELRKMTAGRRGGTRILYGGSAGPGTFERLRDGVDGLFLGRFAHDLEQLAQVLKEVGGAG
ncbi:MAG: hypothetical protein M1827_004063 [Pycnora praestabilis]|nr:MAG: hypothetical protein M1827_004063 [Pycnora praestabilis]